MAARGGGIGCLGIVGLLLVGSVLISLLMVLVGVAAVLACVGGAVWLLTSAIADLQSRSALRSGNDPVLATGRRARQRALESHREAAAALSDTLTAWEHLRVTRGIGTPLQDRFDRFEERTVFEPRFVDLILRAHSAHTGALLATPDSAGDLVRSTLELDEFTARTRAVLLEAARD